MTDPNFKTVEDGILEDLNKYRGLPFSMDETESLFFCLCQSLTLNKIESVHQKFLHIGEDQSQTEEYNDESNSYRSTLNDEENEEKSGEMLTLSKSSRKPNSSSRLNNLTEEQKSDSLIERKKSSLDMGPGITLTKRHSSEVHISSSHEKKLNNTHKGNLYRRIEEEDEDVDVKNNAADNKTEELPPLAEFNRYLSLNVNYAMNKNINPASDSFEELPPLKMK